jgi:hypothetical protein
LKINAFFINCLKVLSNDKTILAKKKALPNAGGGLKEGGRTFSQFDY